MKKIKVLFGVLFFIALFSLSSCYTKKRGVVPCPTWGQVNQGQTNSAAIVTAPIMNNFR